MRTHRWLLAVMTTVALTSGKAWAQHEGHQPAGTQAPSAELMQCMRVQPVIENIIATATVRAEAARLSNSPSELRAAVEHLEAALRDIRAQSQPCATAAASADPHAGHTVAESVSTPKGTTPANPPSPSPAKPDVSDAHVGHASASPTKTKPVKPDAGKPEVPTTADPHAAHPPAPPHEKQMDPVNGLMVDPGTAFKTTYQGHTYYFSSEQSRKEFLANPAKFAKKPKG